MAEWFKAAVLKTVVPRGTVGSNPTPSAIETPRVYEEKQQLGSPSTFYITSHLNITESHRKSLKTQFYR
jgi:hypothetical protein